MPTLDDFECDFDHAIAELAEQVQREIEAIPEADRPRELARRQATRLCLFIEIDAPMCVIETAMDSLRRRLDDLAASRPV